MLFKPDFLSPLTFGNSGLGATGEWLFAKRTADGDAMFMLPLRHDPAGAFKRVVKKSQTGVPITQALLGYEVLMHHAPDYRGEPVLAFTRYISEMDWGIVAKVDEAEVDEMLNKNREFTVLLAISASCFALIIGAFLTLYITRPVLALNRQVRQVQEGSEGRAKVHSGWKEINELSNRLGEVIQVQNDFNTRLETEVEARTSELRQANHVLNELASNDAVTNVVNRRAFDRKFSEVLNVTEEEGGELVAAMIDIDNFKQINDVFGHAFGDEVLIELADILKRELRESDIIARFGGDEFCVLLSGVSRESAMALFERLREKLGAHVFVNAGQEISVSCSIGNACKDRSFNPETLLDKADVALYEAKKAGRNRVVTYLKK